MTQKEFLNILHTKYQFKITGFGEKEVDIEIVDNDKYVYFLIPYTKRTVRNNIYMDAKGEPFTITSLNYTIKDKDTGEIKHCFIPRSKVLFTTLYQRDLIILEVENEYDQKIKELINEYQIVEPHRVPLFYRTNKDTFINDFKELNKKHGKQK